MEPSLSIVKTLQQKIKAFRIFAQNRKMADNNERRALSFKFISTRGTHLDRGSPNETIYGIRLDDCEDYVYLFARENVRVLGDRNHVRIQLNQTPASNHFCLFENGREIVVRVRSAGIDRELFLILPQGPAGPETSLFTTGRFADLFREFTELEYELHTSSPEVSKEPSPNPSPHPPPPPPPPPQQ